MGWSLVRLGGLAQANRRWSFPCVIWWFGVGLNCDFSSVRRDLSV